MPIGDNYYFLCKNRVQRFFVRNFGTLDLHSHIRLKSVLLFIRNYLLKCKNRQNSVLEIGCGNGINAFELLKIAECYHKKITYVGLDIDSKGVAQARQVSDFIKLEGKTTFLNRSASDYLSQKHQEQFDIILLVDIIEHIENVPDVLKALCVYLKKDGIIIVSVPTVLYQKYFGIGFHKRIGHLVDGYKLEELDHLFIDNLALNRIAYKYNTGALSNIGCFLYYNFDNIWWRIKYWKSIVLYSFRFLDFYNCSSTSCSLSAVYKK